MAGVVDIAKVNHYLELANYPYYDPSNEEAFLIFASGHSYSGNADVNVKTAYLYSIFLNMIRVNETGYVPAILHKIAYEGFISNAGEGL